MLVQTFFATFGAGSAFLRQKTERLAKLTCFLTIKYRRECSSILKLIVSLSQEVHWGELKIQANL
jgi:hypothetical protein